MTRPLESYLDGYYAQQLASGGSILPPGSRHVLLAACDRHSQAFETHEQRGVFSETLLAALEEAGPAITYADLFLKVRSLVRRHAWGQNPQFEARQGFNAYHGFLNRLATRRGKRYSVRYVDWEGWRFECGVINGLPADLDTAVELQLYRPDKPEEPLGNALTTSIGLTESEVELRDFTPDKKTVYEGEITSMPAPGLAVCLEGESKGIESLLETTGGGRVVTSFVWDTEHSDGLKYSVTARDEGFDIRLLADGLLIQRVLGQSTDAAAYVCSVLNRIAAWEHAIHLHNLSPAVDTSAVEFRFVEIDAAGNETVHSGPEVTFDIVPQNGGWSEVSGQIRGRNTSDQRLNLMLVYFTGQFEIRVLYNEPHDLDKDEFTFQLDVEGDIYEQIHLALDDEEGDQATHTLMLFVSKDKVDDFMLDQPAIEMGKVVDAFGPRQTRGMKFTKKVSEVSWFTRKIQIHLVRQASRLQPGADAVLADERVRIKAHPAFTAGASLLPAADVTRGAGSADFTRALADQGFELLNLSTARGRSHNVLEFNNIRNPESLEQQPLEIELDFQLADDESVVPVVFDGEHVLLAGDAWKDDAGKTQIVVRKIPEDRSGGRSALSAFRMYFLKSVCGFKRVASLCSCAFDDHGRIRRSTSGLGEKVAQASNILILIHGIAGDSQAMLEQMRGVMQPAGDGPPLPFDLVLGFDYESINTPLENSARELKELLKTKGIDENSEQHITIVAHSIGGLLARWFVEQEGGNRMVDHLVLCGTPNEGSPFGMLSLAPSALSNLINVAIDFTPAVARAPVQALQGILARASLTTTLSQLHERSDFMLELNSSEDPGIRYTVLAGDISDDTAHGDDAGRFQRLLLKIGASDSFHKLFGNSPHDIAVSVDSMRAVLDNRSPAPVKQNLTCHHLNYFSSDPGIECLSQIDWTMRTASE